MVVGNLASGVCGCGIAVEDDVDVKTVNETEG